MKQSGPVSTHMCCSGCQIAGMGSGWRFPIALGDTTRLNMLDLDLVLLALLLVFLALDLALLQTAK